MVILIVFIMINEQMRNMLSTLIRHNQGGIYHTLYRTLLLQIFVQTSLGGA